MARYGIPNPNPVGAFAEGLAGGIASGQQAVANQIEIRRARREDAATAAADKSQQDISSIDTSAIPAPLPADQQGPPVPTPWEKLDTQRAIAMANPNRDRRNDLLQQLDQLAMHGAIDQTAQARQALMHGDNQNAVDKLNQAVKFADSNAPSVFKVAMKDGKEEVQDWEGKKVDGAYLDSIGILAGTARTNPTAAVDYLRKIADDEAKRKREDKVAESTIEYQGKIGGAAATNAQTNAADQKATEKYRAASIYTDILRIQSSMGSTAPKFEELLGAAQKGVTTANTDPQLAPLIASLPTQVEGATVGILGMNPGLPPSTAALGAAMIAGTVFMKTLPEDQRDTLNKQFGDTGLPYELETPKASDQKDANGKPVAYQTRVVKRDEKGNVQPMTPYFIAPGSMINAPEAAPAAPGVTPEQGSGAGTINNAPRYESYTDASGKQQVRQVGVPLHPLDAINATIAKNRATQAAAQAAEQERLRAQFEQQGIPPR